MIPGIAASACTNLPRATGTDGANSRTRDAAIGRVISAPRMQAVRPVELRPGIPTSRATRRMMDRRDGSAPSNHSEGGATNSEPLTGRNPGNTSADRKLSPADMTAQPTMSPRVVITRIGVTVSAVTKLGIEEIVIRRRTNRAGTQVFATRM